MWWRLAFFGGTLLGVVATFDVAAQYAGGDADGAAVNSLTQSVCGPLATDQNFFGGDGDGFASNTLSQSACPPLASDINFFGGDGDGFASNNLTQSTCPPLATDQNFFGGDGDGFSKNDLTQSVCPPLAIDQNFFGGDGDGFASNSLSQSVCPPLEIDSNYFGGNDDGFAHSSLIQSVCPPLQIDSNFFGGDDDGFAFNFIQQCDPLPIELLDFNVQEISEGILVSWSTASETNNDFFSVERTQSAVSFEPIGILQGAGNSLVKLDYLFIDRRPPVGTSYYRLKQTDFDGQYSYSTVKSITIDRVLTEPVLMIFPNPATTRQVEVKILGATNAVFEVDVADLTGRLLQVFVVEVAESRNAAFTLPLPDAIAPGVYLVRVKGEKNQLITKLLIR